MVSEWPVSTDNNQCEDAMARYPCLNTTCVLSILSTSPPIPKPDQNPSWLTLKDRKRGSRLCVQTHQLPPMTFAGAPAKRRARSATGGATQPRWRSSTGAAATKEPRSPSTTFAFARQLWRAGHDHNCVTHALSTSGFTSCSGNQRFSRVSCAQVLRRRTT